MSRARHEYKYLIDRRTEEILKIRAQGILMADSHVNTDGCYYIRSLYFDDQYDSCLRENIAGTDPRSKFRIRYYNNDPSVLHLEKKSKERGMTRKESCSLQIEECTHMMAGNIPEFTDEMPEIKKKLLSEMAIRGLIPKVIVSYERIPFVYPGGNVRVTFDRNLSSSMQIESFLDGDYIGRPVYASGNSILEVKWDEILPRHIHAALNLDCLQWTAFSKYSTCRRYHL